MFGVNILGDYKKAFELAGKYNVDFIQIDSVCGHLTPEQDSPYADELMTLMEDRTFQVLGGLRFKYQPIRSGRTLEKDAELARQRCDAAVTTGEGTGKNCPTEKLFEFRKVLKDFPLIVGAGVTAGNVCEKLEYVDGVIIGSWLKEGHNDYGDVCEEYVKEFMDNYLNDEKMLKTFPNLKVTDINGNIVLVKDVFPDIQPYYVKLFTPKQIQRINVEN
mgnify:CR=1 FL=1